MPVLLIGVCAVSAHDVDPIVDHRPNVDVLPISDNFRPHFDGNISEIPPYWIEPVSPDDPLFKFKDYPSDLETLLEMYGIRPISDNNVSDNVFDDYVDLGNVDNGPVAVVDDYVGSDPVPVPVVDDSSVDLGI